jgi:uncharacterized protein (TIGR02145 family)
VVSNSGGYEIIDRGLCWGILPNPTIDENHTSLGPGTGSFVSNIDGLQPNTSYFIKAYAINSLGVGYGEQLVFTTLANGSVCGEIVNYEGKDYNTLAIGGQCWFKENLDVGIMIDYPQNQLNNGIIEKYCGYNESSNCELYGGLYRWDEMMNYQPVTLQQGICPDGWHVPSDIELSILNNFVSLHPDFLCDNNPVNIAKSLAGTTDWYTSVTNCTVGKDLSSNNSTNFSGLPGGAQNYEFFEGPGSDLYLWSSTENLLSESWFYSLDSYDSVMHRVSYNKNTGRSVRCLKDQSVVPFLQVVTSNIIDTTEYSAIGGGEIISNGGFAITERGVCWSIYENPTIYDTHTNDGTGSGIFTSNLTGLIPNTDYYVRAYAINSLGITYGNEITFTTLPGLFTCGDFLDYYGQKYYTVQIGSQCWFKDNLNMGEFINGSISQTNNNIFEKHCYYNQESNCEVYGGLYQWDEMMQYTTQQGAQGICPNDWHIPSLDEFNLLIDYLGGTNVSGGEMKETGTLHWLPPNTGATNGSGFTGLPGGVSKGSQSCFDLGAIGYYWSSTGNTGWAHYGYLTYDSAMGTTDGITKEYGLSVRCLKD